MNPHLSIPWMVICVASPLFVWIYEKPEPKSCIDQRWTGQIIYVSNRINSWYLFWSKCSQLFQSTGYNWWTVCNAPTLYASVSELQMLVCIVQTVNCSGWYCSPHPLTLFNLDPARNATRNSIGFAIVRRPLLQTLCSTVQLTTVPVSLSITKCCTTN